ncbi:MAG: rRNA methyltransferase [Micrococcales bacterium 73-13]|nr:MAG: rRNA methyltransferase [Micrococcales bacterium 73-13]
MPELIRVRSLADDPRLADYANLTDVALRRRLEPAGGLYVAEGLKVLRRALEAGHSPRSALVLDRRADEVVAALGDRGTTVFVGDGPALAALAGFDVHRGVLAAMHRPALPDPLELIRDARTVVVLEDVVEHANVGAAFRSAAALGADSVLVTPRCADPLYRRSIRVGMGAVFQVPWTRVPWPAGYELIRGAGLHLAALALSDDAVELDEFARRAPERIALLLGTEGDGLSRRALGAADTVVRIEMAGGVDSLNVAAASAVALHAIRRRAS